MKRRFISTEEQHRSRWRRWLGQKLRPGGSGWTTLLDASIKGWPCKVLGRECHCEEDSKKYWLAAINKASTQELQRLEYLNL